MDKTLPKLIIVLSLLCVSLFKGVCQETSHSETIRQQFITYSASYPEIDQRIDITAGKIKLGDLIRNIANTTGINVTIRDLNNQVVNCNFSNASVSDILAFMCCEYNLRAEFTGNIISLSPVPEPPALKRIPKVNYHISSKIMEFDLKDDLLEDVARRINELTGHNLIYRRDIAGTRLTGLVSGLKLDESLMTLAEMNGLIADRTGSDIWHIFSIGSDPPAPASSNKIVRKRNLTSGILEVDSLGSITAQLNRVNSGDLIMELCDRLSHNYFFLTAISHPVSINVTDIDFETVLHLIFAGTQNSYYRDGNIYVFGTRGGQHNMNSAKVISLRYRSVAELADFIPDNIIGGLDLKTFVDLNSIIVSGDHRNISRVENYIKGIDIQVPLITIEIIIADVTKARSTDTGFTIGKGDAPDRSTGTFGSGLDITLNSSGINRLISSFNGFGSVNLGKVGSDFYMNLRLLEEDGVLSIKSTPKLSTLNGHEANLKSGEKRYYKEVTNTYMGSQNPIQNETYTWRDVEANLSVKITPFVSDNEDITLDIEIEQSEFTTQVDKDAPPGSATRSFKSLIRVRNEEMVLLGGIDRNTTEKSSSGLPLISRIPVLKWIFGSNKNNKSEQKLSVFIKPTILH